MIGYWSSQAALAVQIFAISSTFVFAVPFVVAPAKWGSAMQWPVPDERQLMAYYARCLGCLSLSFNLMGLWATRYRPDLLIAYVAPVTVFCATMVLLHCYGAWRREQPWTETAEIPMWSAFTLLGLMLMPA